MISGEIVLWGPAGGWRLVERTECETRRLLGLGPREGEALAEALAHIAEARLAQAFLQGFVAARRGMQPPARQHGDFAVIDGGKR